MGKGKATDILVVGAGIFGLSCAYACVARGLTVTVVDRASPGAGASGGPVGALSPHPPERWNLKKQFQLETLLAAEAHWREIAAIGGVDPGYGRIGRLIPLRSEGERARAGEYARNAPDLWPREVGWTVLDPAETPGCLAPEAVPHGVVLETLSARINPPKAIKALVAALTRRGVRFQFRLEAVSVANGTVRFRQTELSADRVILAGGYDGFALLAPSLGHNPGQGIKGQAALVLPVRPIDAPILYCDGIYIVPHADGTLAIGSTSEARWADPSGTDALLDDLLLRAAEICPGIAGARILRRWAGVRPRGYRPDPMLGVLPDLDRVFVANGGFRTGLALGPAVGAALADMVTGTDSNPPPGMGIADHLRKGTREMTPRL